MNPASAFQQAQELIAQGDAAAAESLLRAHPGDEACTVRLREMLIGERRDEEALPVVRSLADGEGAEAGVSRSILAFRAGDLQRAVEECRAALNRDPASATAHNHMGRALHNLGLAGQALDAFRRATELESGYPEAWHNLGHAQRSVGDLAGAVDAFRQALELAPAYRQAWENLGVTLFHQDRVEEAHACFQRLLERDPTDAAALLGAGLCLHLFGRFEEAQAAFQKVISREPGNAVAHLYLGVLQNEMLDTEAALASLRRATELDPTDVEAWVELGGVLEQANRLDEAARALLRGFEADPGHPGLNLETAKVERRQGHTGSALRRLRGIDVSSLPSRLAQQFWFELGLVLDRDGEADAAIEAFSTGNRLARDSVRARTMDPAALEWRCQQLDDWLARGVPGAIPRDDDPTGDTGSDLCFLVGFPRSGTTLIDTTLETHPGVRALEEAPTLDQVVTELASLPQGYPAALRNQTAEEVARLRTIYRSAVARLLGEGRPLLTVDKMPLRFMHAGLISRLFPAARMLFVLRHPCDVVLSNFMQQYVVNETNIHFDTLAHCAQTYDRIMRLWQATEPLLDLNVEYVRYEALVEDAPAAIHRICRFLGVDADEVSFEARARLGTRDRIVTSSYQQVGEPIYSRAAGRWCRYRRHLEPVLPILAPHAERYGYSLEE